MAKNNNTNAIDRLARYANGEMFDVHRGAISDGKRTFMFGNDGYGDDDHSPREVELLREKLAENGIREIAFSVQGEDDYTWGMLVDGDCEKWGIETLWTCWNASWLEEDDSEDSQESLGVVQSTQMNPAAVILEEHRDHICSLIEGCPED